MTKKEKEIIITSYKKSVSSSLNFKQADMVDDCRLISRYDVLSKEQLLRDLGIQPVEYIEYYNEVFLDHIEREQGYCIRDQYRLINAKLRLTRETYGVNNHYKLDDLRNIGNLGIQDEKYINNCLRNIELQNRGETA